MSGNLPIHPHSKQQSPWINICKEKLKHFENSVNHVQFDLHATTHIKPTRGSYKCYIWLSRETYSVIKMKVRIRYDHDITVLDKTLQSLFDSVKPANYVNQDDISTEICHDY